MKVAEKGYFELKALNRDGLVLFSDMFYGTEEEAMEREQEMYNEDDVYHVSFDDQRPRWDMYQMRRFCIKYNYFDAGTNKAYDTLLKYVETREPNEKTVGVAAIFIMHRTSKFEDIIDGEKFDGIYDMMCNDIWTEVIY